MYAVGGRGTASSVPPVTRARATNVYSDLRRLKLQAYQQRCDKAAVEAPEEPEFVVSVVFFTGHGDEFGDWMLHDQYIELEELISPPDYVELYDLGRPLIIVSDCCYAGNWCVSRAAAKWGLDVTMVAAATPGVSVFERSCSPGEASNFMQLLLSPRGAATAMQPQECSLCKTLRTKKVTTRKNYAKQM